MLKKLPSLIIVAEDIVGFLFNRKVLNTDIFNLRTLNSNGVIFR